MLGWIIDYSIFGWTIHLMLKGQSNGKKKTGGHRNHTDLLG